jgi:hypothetical protein
VLARSGYKFDVEVLVPSTFVPVLDTSAATTSDVPLVDLLEISDALKLSAETKM